ncbi:6738_t:CDS:2 [Paraglomus brasilianum]|uniref:6738_t:CDS:1 n=1 Tax=Paraglomus brasilianum TaxID=144538 RepID=A0A9N8YVL9_9GLOM|nr:6738_t:CDS:2 [Paraglomus brasilianum]
MFNTTTTAFYHPTDGQKSYFNNFSTSISSSLLHSSLVLLPLSKIFGSNSTSVTKPSNNASDSTNNSEIPPAQPTEEQTTTEPIITSIPSTQSSPSQPQKRSSRRTQRHSFPSSLSISAAISSSMGNILPSTSNNVITPSTTLNQYSHAMRKKKPANKLNRKKIDSAITLSAIAVEEDSQGNYKCATDLYLSALEDMLYALPVQADPVRQEALRKKLLAFLSDTGMSDEFALPSTPPKHGRSNSDPTHLSLHSSSSSSTTTATTRSRVSDQIINAAINGAVALKQSPIPDAISATVNYTMKKIKNIDETYGLQEKAWEISRSGINLALEIDQQYNVHEKVGNALFTGIAAAMKAGIAYKDSPGYKEVKRMRMEYCNGKERIIEQNGTTKDLCD